MRFKSKPVDNYCIYAVAGTNSVSFGIDYTKADTKGLLGFAVKRTDPGKADHFLTGFKGFQSEKNYDPHKQVSTEEHPVQSFVWDDFALSPAENYTYTFYPMKGKPGALVKQKPIIIKVSTEPAFSDKTHDVFFNRGVASSQAYERKFNNKSPHEMVGKEKQEAYNWLGRDLLPALLKFIDQAKKGETLLGCFYEFNFPDVLNAFKKAIDKGVNVKLIVDMKKNKGETPRKSNLAAITKAKIKKIVIPREANKNKIQHNKFIVYLQGKAKKPVACGPVQPILPKAEFLGKLTWGIG